jgi:hypothetical protein
MMIIRANGAHEDSHVTHIVSRRKAANFAEITAIKRRAGCTKNIL